MHATHACHAKHVKHATQAIHATHATHATRATRVTHATHATHVVQSLKLLTLLALLALLTAFAAGPQCKSFLEHWKGTFQEAIKQWKSPQRTADEPVWQRAVPRPRSPRKSDCGSDKVQREM